VKSNRSLPVTALVTGRRGSSLAGKNLLEVLGKPCAQHGMEAARRLGACSNFVVSSDDSNLLALGERHGYRPLLRPAHLSTDDAQHEDVLKHALPYVSLNDDGDGLLLVLLANAPVVRVVWIEECLQIMIDNPSSTAVIPCYEDADHHPLRALTVGNTGYLGPFVQGQGAMSTNRQALPSAVFACHNFWLIRIFHGMLPSGHGPWPFFGSAPVPYVIDQPIYDIHTSSDVSRVEEVMRTL
jgi:CMP-N-acetylneuraminic acid synthetase